MPSRIYRDDLLSGKVALVTGGGTGIGAAIAREFGHCGATVVIASRKEENIRPAAEGLSKELGREVTGLICDIRDHDSVTRCAADILEKHGRIDILVNNGGGQFFLPAEGITPGGFDAVVNTNLTGTWNMIRAVADAWMLEHGGKIVNITMLTARAFPGMAHSVASRAGVEAMSRTLAVEWASRNIQINCVQPGYIASSGLKRYPVDPSWFKELQSHLPAKRLGTSEEVAWSVVYLAGPSGDFVTGTLLTIDGGKTLWGDYWDIPDPDPMPEVDIPTEPWEQA